MLKVGWLICCLTAPSAQICYIMPQEYEISLCRAGEQDKHTINQWRNTLNRKSDKRFSSGLSGDDPLVTVRPPQRSLLIPANHLASTDNLTRTNNQETENIQTQTNVNTRSSRNKQYKTHPQKNLCYERGKTESGLVAFYNIRSGNGAGLFLQPLSPHGAPKRRQCWRVFRLAYMATNYSLACMRSKYNWCAFLTLTRNQNRLKLI